MTDRQLLDLRLCDLPVKIRGTQLEQRIKRLYREMEARSIHFRPHVWLGEEWFTPDGVAGFAIPFYLAHPRLMKLERSQMLEVEGASESECMRILRHEAGHAIDNAYRLHSRRSWSNTFGSYRVPYPEWYQPQPGSRDYVLNLDAWYAQAHPAEDFAETFAVWLTPNSMWAERYKGWPVMRKLQYMDSLMQGLAGVMPAVTTSEQVDPLPALKRTLREHYARKRGHYGVARSSSYDPDLKRLFSDAPVHAERMSAAVFLNRFRREVRRKVASWTGEYQYTIDQVLQDMIDRCRELRLHLPIDEEQTKLDFTILLTVHTMNFLRSGRHKVAV